MVDCWHIFGEVACLAAHPLKCTIILYGTIPCIGADWKHKNCKWYVHKYKFCYMLVRKKCVHLHKFCIIGANPGWWEGLIDQFTQMANHIYTFFISSKSIPLIFAAGKKRLVTVVWSLSHDWEMVFVIYVFGCCICTVHKII